MLRWIHRITLMALCSLTVTVVHAENQSISQSSPDTIQKDMNKLNSQFIQSSQESLMRRIAISERANTIFTLFASELAWGQGQGGTALATNEMILKKSQDPAVAERAMEMALNMQAFSQAKNIFNEWQKLQSENTPAKERLSWQLALAQNDIEFVSKHMDTVLNNATDYQLRYLFLLLAQSSIGQKKWPASVYSVIHKTAQQHKDMQEAIIADAIYSALGGYDKQAIIALQQLATLDSNMQPATQITINIIGQTKPQILASFFQPDSFINLPPAWQSAYIEWLVTHKEVDYANKIIQPVLKNTQSPELYLQAVFLAINQQASIDTIVNYAQQGYLLGDDIQKSKISLMLAVYMAERNENVQARQWAQKITAPQFSFDHAIILATIEQQDKHWQKAQSWLRTADKLKQSGQFFDQNNLFRLQVIQANETLTPTQYLNKLNIWLKKAENQKDDDHIAEIIFLRGMVYTDKLHQPQKAVEDFRRYLKLRPENVEGLNSLGYTLLSLSHEYLAEALTLLERAYQLDNQSAYISDSLGWAYYLNGEIKKALPLLQYAYTQYPNAEVAAHLGAALWDSGEQDQARQIWAQGRESKDSHYVLTQVLKRFKIDPATLPVKSASPIKKEQ